jgi:hypothetical protein
MKNRNEARNLRILRAYLAGTEFDLMAERFQLSKKYLSRIIRALKPDNKPRMCSPEDNVRHKEMALRYRHQLSASKIAEMAGTTKNVIIGHWYRHGQTKA